LAIAPETESQAWRSRGPAWQERGGEPRVLRSGREVALEHGVRRGRDRRGLEQIAIAVAEGVDAEAGGEVEAPGAVGEPHARAATAGPEQHG
jgi:hypothetical protein